MLRVGRTQSASVMTPESFIEAIRRRCGDISCGTIWWCEELLWIEKLPHYYQPKYPGHPALSIWLFQHRRSLDAVPMLYGSRRRGRQVAVVARDLSRKYPRGTLTYFGEFGPVRMEVGDLTSDSATTTGQHVLSDLDLTAWFSRPRLVRNQDKDRLSDVEFAELQGWMEQQGWRI